MTPRGPSSNPLTPLGGPAAGGPAVRGTPMVFTRGRTSSDRLRIAWNYPVPEADSQPLAYELALSEVRGADTRPVLVIRECERCAGTDDALLSRSLNNERTLILSRWFHCVKLPAKVLDKDHGFHALFAGEDPPHLFLVSADGGERVAFDGGQKQGDLWKAMQGVLARDYVKQPEPSVKRLLHLLDRFDQLDQEEDTLRAQLDSAIVAKGATSESAKKLLDKLNELQVEKKKALDEEKELGELQRRG